MPAAALPARMRARGATDAAASLPVDPDVEADPVRLPAPRCRMIEEHDLAGVVALLRIGFPDRSAAYWYRGFARHAARVLPDGAPRYGYVIDDNGDLVGVLLTFYAAIEGPDGPSLRCNLSSWYVEPRFRAMATLLDGYAMRDRTVTYLNVSPAPRTLAMHEARGFRRYCGGQMLVIPVLSRWRRGLKVASLSPETAALLSSRERVLALDHSDYGCLCLVLLEHGTARVVVLRRRALKLSSTRMPRLALPSLQIVYGPEDLPRWLGPLGRYLLAKHAMAWLVIDANGPLTGVRGHYFAGRAPKLVRGPHPARLGDLSYTEIALFDA